MCRLNRSWIGLAVLAAVSVHFVGCSSSTSPAPDEAKPAAEVRGEAIGAPPVAATNTPQPAAAVASAPESESTPTPAPVTAGVVASTPPPAAPAAQPAEAEPAVDEKGFLNVGFEKLSSFDFVVSDEQMLSTNETESAASPADQIPKEIRSLNQKRIGLKGFMLPLKVESGLVTEMLIMRDQSMCCYGTVPKINEWVSVKMKAGVKAVMDQPVTIFGKLNVGEMRENGYLVGIYSLDGEGMAGPLDL